VLNFADQSSFAFAKLWLALLGKIGMKNKGYILVFLTALISGFSIFINKFGVSLANPYIFTGLKNIVVAVFLSCLLIYLKDLKVLKSLAKKDWILLVLIGFIGGSVPFLLFFKGLSLTTAAQGSFFHKTMFLYVAILAAVFLKEKISREFLIGALFLLSGSALILKTIPHSFGIGDLYIVLAALFWAGENVLSKHTLRRLSGRVVAWGRMFFGSLFILLFLLMTSQISLVGALTPNQMVWVLITSVFLFGYVITWYSGLKYVPVSRAACILLLGSPITTLLSVVFLNSIIIPGEIFGVSLTLLGLILILGGKYVSTKLQEYVRI